MTTMTPLDRLLYESRLDFLRDRYGDKVDKTTLEILMAADPTSKNDRPGGYADWIIRLYIKAENKQRLLEDLYKITSDLRIFDTVKHKLPVEQRDINKLTPQSLFEFVEPFTAQVAEKDQATAQGTIPGAEILYKDPKVTVYNLKTHEAAVKIGRGTRWCTSADSAGGASTFRSYLKSGRLLVFSFVSGAAYQLHDTDSPEPQFMNKNDNSISVKKFVTQCCRSGNKQFLKFLSELEIITVGATEKGAYDLIFDKPISQNTDRIKLAYIGNVLKKSKKPVIIEFLFYLVTELAEKYPENTAVKDVVSMYASSAAGKKISHLDWTHARDRAYKTDGLYRSRYKGDTGGVGIAAGYAASAQNANLYDLHRTATGAGLYADNAGVSFAEQLVFLQKNQLISNTG